MSYEYHFLQFPSNLSYINPTSLGTLLSFTRYQTPKERPKLLRKQLL